MNPSGSIEKALDLLMLFGADSDSRKLSLHEVARMMNVPKTTAHRLLQKLVSKNFLEKDSTANSYVLGFGARILGERYVYSRPMEQLLTEHLKQIVRCFGESASASFLDGSETVIQDKMEGTHALRAIAQVGSRNPIHCSGSGKVFLAWMEPKKARELLEGIAPLKRYTKSTYTDIPDLLEHLKAERMQGYAVDFEELHQGQVCISAPVYGTEGTVCVALTVSGPKDRIVEKGIDVIGKQLQNHCAKISEELGFVHSTEQFCVK